MGLSDVPWMVIGCGRVTVAETNGGRSGLARDRSLLCNVEGRRTVSLMAALTANSNCIV